MENNFVHWMVLVFLASVFNFSTAHAVISETPRSEFSTQSTKPILQSIAPPTFDLRILKGNLELGEGFGLGHSTVSGAQVDLSPTIKYFVADHLALGVSMNLFADNLGSAGLVGPAVDYYFMQRKNWTFLVTQEFLKPFRDRGNRYSEEDWTSMSRLGVKYFSSQKVALGLDFVYKTPLNTDPGYRETRVGLQFRIGFFY